MSEPINECLHETLYFGSGDFYLICRKCERYWRMEDRYFNNQGAAGRLSGEERGTMTTEVRILEAELRRLDPDNILLAKSGFSTPVGADKP